MAALSQAGPVSSERLTSNMRSVGPLQLIQGSLSARRVARQSPVLAGLHRVVDGSLMGAFIAVTLMSTLTLHLQHRWTVAFRRVEVTRNLAHRLTESTAMLESDFLEKIRLPDSMVRTKTSNLLYLEQPSSTSRKKHGEIFSSLVELLDNHISYGY